VVAVLGLNDGEFPRSAGDSGLDAMSRLRRIGDRDVRTDDRYLFLETVMSARQRLHLSFIGKGVRDGKPRNPAPPLAELLAALDVAAGISSDADQTEQPRPWRVDHPLQPFDRRYFSADTASQLFSYSQANLTLARAEGAPRGAFIDLSPGADAELSVESEHAAQPPTQVPLRALLDYFRNPSRQVLRDRLGVRLDALDDDRLSDSEPLEARFEAIDRIGRRLFLEAAQRGDLTLPDEPPGWLRLTGLLPPGRPGLRAWLNECEKVARLISAALDHPLFAGGALPPIGAMRLNLPLGRWQLVGESNLVHRADQADWLFEVFPRKSAPEKGKVKLYSEQELGFRERIPAFIEWAALRLSQPRQRPVRICLLTESLVAPWQDAINDWDARWIAAEPDRAEAMRSGLADRLDQLIDFWHGAQSRPRWYFPKTSWCAVTGDAGKATATFIGSGRIPGERDYAPGYAALLAGDIDFAPGSCAREQLDADAKLLQQLIQLDPDEAGQ
jgi:exodeoxyribonuclease V gamma subunit